MGDPMLKMMAAALALFAIPVTLHAQECMPKMGTDIAQWSQKGDDALREGIAKCPRDKFQECRDARRLFHDRYEDALYDLAVMQAGGSNTANMQAVVWKRIASLLEKTRTP